MRVVCYIAVTVALAGATARAQDPVREALSRTGAGGLLASNLVIADLDCDQKADAAILLREFPGSSRGTSRVELHLTRGPDASIDVGSLAFGDAIVARDVDQDSDADLVVERLFGSQGVRVWLNDGQGAFSEGDVRDYPSLSQPAREKVNAPSRERANPAASLPPQRWTSWATVASDGGINPGLLHGRRVCFDGDLPVPQDPCSTGSSRSPPLP